ncbi:MAG: hypothetical protein HON90_12660, partial [Halobacteriovoraceae bacterium]|nr:hypothetical protein [Halobacteriovoraceae bacterium]
MKMNLVALLLLTSMATAASDEGLKDLLSPEEYSSIVEYQIEKTKEEL